MGIITKIEEQKNKNRVNIFVDEAFFSGIEKETALLFGLKEGKTVDEETLKQACHESEVKRAFEKACDYLGIRMHSRKELETKLLKKGFAKNVIFEAVNKLQEYNYIDDKLFAKSFVETNSKDSKKVLEMKLTMRGVNKIIIGEVLSEITSDDEFELCKLQAKKYARGKDVSSKEGVQKLFASLARKGFGFDVIKKVVKQLTNEEIETD